MSVADGDLVMTGLPERTRRAVELAHQVYSRRDPDGFEAELEAILSPLGDVSMTRSFHGDLTIEVWPR